MPVEEFNQYVYGYSPASLGDYNNDGYLETYAVGYAGVRALDHEGTYIWKNS